jgi:hypothetical protein
MESAGARKMLNVIAKARIKNLISGLAAVTFLFVFSSLSLPKTAKAYSSCCACVCMGCVIPEHEKTRAHITLEFKLHRDWMVNEFFRMHILRAMMMMTEQLTVVGMQQVEIIGTFLDAKHQLETQRLFQQLQAKAHKDYHPSEAVCTFGTNIRALSASERKSEFIARAMAEHSMQRQLLNGDRASSTGRSGDMAARIEKFKTTYCDIDDNGRGLKEMCGSDGPKVRVNKDINYTRLVDDALTLKVDFQNDSFVGTPDQEDVLSMQSNLFGHEVSNVIEPTYLDQQMAQELYMDLRSVVAKRSVLVNAFNHQVGLRAWGSGGNDQYIRKILYELGTPLAEIDRMHKDISYYAQLRALVKSLQGPRFITKLYDTPANVARLGVSLQALALQLDWQMLRSNWRLEMIMAVDAELALMKVQEAVQDEIAKIGEDVGTVPMNITPGP